MIGRTFSHYKILQKLGEGGMGVVYKAEDTKLLRPVALKFLSPELTRDQEAKRRFVREARAASSLDHPNIAVVHDFDETGDGLFFICMAYYEGQTLASKLSKGALELEDAARIALQIASGLESAHDSGIVHHDIKPSNIIITKQGEVKIVDFGLAKLSEHARETRSQTTGGTAAYMSPEQILNAPTDARSDLFSLGVLLFEATTGKRPFLGDHEAALYYSIVNLEPPLPSTILPNVSPELEKIILRLLEKEPKNRYQSASDVIVDLKVYLGLTPKAPRRTPRLQRAKKRLVVAALMLIPIVILLGLWFAVSGNGFPLSPTDYVLLAKFQNQTDERLFDNSLTEAMKVSLRQSGQFNLFPNERINDALERMKSNLAPPLDESTAIEVARREGVRIVLAGSISQVGGLYLLRCKIIDAVTGDPVSLPSSQLRSSEEILGGIDDLCKKIRSKLGESYKEISRYSLPLAKVTTQSFQALDLYSRAEIYESQGKYSESAELKAKAVSKDTTFVRAISDLSYIYSRLRDDSLALTFHRRVIPLLDKTSERDRLYILSYYYGPDFELDFDSAFTYARRLVLLHPNSDEGYGILAWLAMYTGDVKTCLSANDRCMAIDSTFAGTCFNNSGFVLAMAGNPDSALAMFRRSKAKRPDFKAIDEYMARTYWTAMRFDSTTRILQAIDSKRSLASFYCFRGELERSAEICRTSIAGAKKPADRSGLYALLAFIERSRGNSQTSLRYIKEGLEKCAVTSDEYVLLAVLMAQEGHISEATRARVSIEQVRDDNPSFRKRKNNSLHLLEGSIELAQKRVGSAMNHLRQVRRLQAGDAVYFLAQRFLGDCLSQRSDTTSVSYYRSLLDMKGEVVMPPQLTSLYPALLWAETELALVQFQNRLGRKGETRFHLEHLKAIWAGADKNYIKNQEAQRLLGKTLR